MINNFYRNFDFHFKFDLKSQVTKSKFDNTQKCWIGHLIRYQENKNSNKKIKCKKFTTLEKAEKKF